MGAPHYECIYAYIFDVEHSYSVVQTYDPPRAWNQNLLLQEQKLSEVEKKAMLQCGEKAYLSYPYSIYVDILSRLNLGNACYHLEQNLFSSSSLI
jgi:hypothetical protein